MLTRTADIFFSRQPILDRKRNVVAYELLYRRGNAGEARVTDDALATARVIHIAFERLGIATVLGRCRGFINVDAEMLLSSRIESLPREQVVLELLETIRVDDRVVQRCGELKRRGFRLALDDFCRDEDGWTPLLELADIVKVDILQLDDAHLADLVRVLRLYPVRLLAEKVDTPARARRCEALGFDLFQGFLFGRPVPTGCPTAPVAAFRAAGAR